MPTPYVTPSMIQNAPTGISWNIIPFPGANDAAQAAEQMNICWRGTGMVDQFCNQVLRATVDTERIYGPDFYVTAQPGLGNVRAILSRFPITNVLQVGVSPNTFPRSWSVVPSGYYEVEIPPIGTYGTTAPSSAGDGSQFILIGGGYVNWGLGRNGFAIEATYLNGWPHTSLTADATQGAQTFQVDDVTGWTGASGFVYDGSATETVTVSSVTANTPFPLPFNNVTYPAGPGTVTLAAPTANAHASGIVVSALPQVVLQAAILTTAVQALDSGILAATVQSMPGTSTMGGHGIADLTTQYKDYLMNYRRTI